MSLNTLSQLFKAMHKTSKEGGADMVDQMKTTVRGDLSKKDSSKSE